MIETEIKIKKLTASEGHVLTDGESYSKDYVYLSVNDKSENWHEITDAEYEVILAEEEKRKQELVNM